MLADDPRLDVRLAGAWRQPLRVVLDTKLRTPPSARLFNGEPKALVFTASSDAASISALQQRGAQIEKLEPLPPAAQLRAVLARLGQLGVNDLLVEAGPTLAGALVQHGLADELLLYIAPRLLGPQARPLFDLPPLEDLHNAPGFRIIDQRRIGNDLRVQLRVT